jgi:type IV secretory pathway component VirB8
MLFSKPKTSERPAAGTEAGLQGTQVYIDLVSGLKAQVTHLRRDNLILRSFLGLCIVGLVLATPLRKRVPYFFEVDSSTGRVALTNRVAEELKVSDKNVAYFIRLWVARMATINAATLKEGLPSAYRWTRGSAQTEMDEWTEKTDHTAERIAKTPGLTRELLGQPTVSFNEDRNIAFVDFSWLEKINGIETERKRKLLTLEFGLVPPKNADEDPDNPLGIGITHFTVNDQVSK